jgi:hypothetical protein
MTFPAWFVPARRAPLGRVYEVASLGVEAKKSRPGEGLGDDGMVE